MGFKGIRFRRGFDIEEAMKILVAEMEDLEDTAHGIFPTLTGRREAVATAFSKSAVWDCFGAPEGFTNDIHITVSINEACQDISLTVPHGASHRWKRLWTIYGDETNKQALFQILKELRSAVEVMNVGIASIKRWETGLIQSKSMDHALRMQSQRNIGADNYTGGREISLPRIKLVAQKLEQILGRRLLKSGDKLLFLAKYLWYADMHAFRQLGRGLTGATYTAITCGPQLNNYRDLVKPIKESDVNDAEPLSEEELRIIQHVAERFPYGQAVYEAAHREKIWMQADTGALISYSCVHELAEI